MRGLDHIPSLLADSPERMGDVTVRVVAWLSQIALLPQPLRQKEQRDENTLLQPSLIPSPSGTRGLSIAIRGKRLLTHSLRSTRPFSFAVRQPPLAVGDPVARDAEAAPLHATIAPCAAGVTPPVSFFTNNRQYAGVVQRPHMAAAGCAKQGFTERIWQSIADAAGRQASMLTLPFGIISFPSILSHPLHPLHPAL
jgi:hypothetical protein